MKKIFLLLFGCLILSSCYSPRRFGRNERYGREDGMMNESSQSRRHKHHSEREYDSSRSFNYQGQENERMMR